MSFIEDGSVGIGTNAPVGILHLKTSAKNTRLAIDGDAGFNKLISYRTAGLQRFGLYTNNTAESGSNAGSNFAIRAYSDAGTLLNTPLFIERSTGNVGINTITGTAKLQVVGSGATSATTSLLVQNSLSNTSLTVDDAGTTTITNGLNITNTSGVGYLNFGPIGGVGRAFIKWSSFKLNVTSVKFGVENLIVDPGATFANLPVSAVADFRSTSSGVLMPRMTTAQKNAITTPLAGLIVYDTTLNKLCVYTGAGWETITSI
jgi:hypothetical protein